MGVFDDMASSEREASREAAERARTEKEAALQAERDRFDAACAQVERIALPVFEEAAAAFRKQGILVEIKVGWRGPNDHRESLAQAVLVIGDAHPQKVRAVWHDDRLQLDMDGPHPVTPASDADFPRLAAEMIRKALAAYYAARHAD